MFCRLRFAIVWLMAAVLWPGSSAAAAAQDNTSGPASLPAMALSLAPIFSDHMVIQRDAPLPVWGSAQPNERLRVVLGSTSVMIGADKNGNWRVVLPRQKVGKPLTLTVSGAASAVRIGDIAVGDVYLCSGQSNMEFPVENSTGGAAAIAGAADPQLRLLHIPRSSGAGASQGWSAPAIWQGATAGSVASFPAACYFMGRELRRTASVPIGLIGAAVGGSAIQAWLSSAAYIQTGGDAERLALAALHTRDALGAAAKWSVMWEAWWRVATAGSLGFPWRARYRPDERWLPEPRGAMWDKWDAPELAGGRGMVFYRTTLNLGAAQAARSGVLELGPIRELDQAWVNGQPIGATYGADSLRAYRLPDGALQAGANTVTLAVDSRWVTGGFQRPELRRLLLDGGASLDLPAWQYRVVPGWIGYMPRPPWNPLTGPSVLHDGMIAPLGNFPLRAVAWYQGEQNGDDASEYRMLLTALMADWRAQFGASTGFLVVQLPNFGARQTASLNSNWPWLREAQRLAVAVDPLARLVVTVDVGDPNDIHPRDKLTVGLRLAREAQSLASGLTFSPTIGTAEVDPGGAVSIKLSGSHKFGARLGAAPGAVAACAFASGSCRQVKALLEDNALRIDGLLKEEDAVTYCWADNPMCNIYDEHGDPLGPFLIKLSR